MAESLSARARLLNERLRALRPIHDERVRRARAAVRRMREIARR